MATTDLAVSARELEFHYREGDFCLRIPVLEVAQGETVAVVGPSGTGKTTLLNLLAGVSVPRAGSIWSAGAEVTALTEVGRRAHRIRNVGMVFQGFELISYLDVLDNVLLPYRLDPGMRLSQEVRSRAMDLGRDLGLGERLHRRVTNLSQGERQRVAIARALVTGASLLLADEPTGNLDPHNKTKIIDLLFEQVRLRGVTLVVVTHDHGLLERFDRVVDLNGEAPES